MQPLKANGTTGRLLKRHGRFHVLWALAVAMLSASGFPQVSVVSGGGPGFPKKVDSIAFIMVADRPHRGHDSLITALPSDFLDECKSAIDSVFPYVDAVRLHRREITGCAAGPRFGNYLLFFNEKKLVMKISFPCKRFDGGLLDVKADKYPFAITFKKALTKKLKDMAHGAKKK